MDHGQILIRLLKVERRMHPEDAQLTDWWIARISELRRAAPEYPPAADASATDQAPSEPALSH
jgi:hypothetical protein